MCWQRVQLWDSSALQYRNDGGYGFWRKFTEANSSHTIKSLYMVETAVHEMMLQVRAPRS